MQLTPKTSVIEINLAVSCGCLSVIRPFLRHHFPLLIGDTRPTPTPSSKYNKARPSDYFLKRAPKVKTADDSYLSTTSSKAQLSQTQDIETGWDKEAEIGYSQKVESEGKNMRSQPNPEFDFELGAMGRGRDDIALGQRVNEGTNNDGIMKTVEYDVRESIS